MNRELVLAIVHYNFSKHPYYTNFVNITTVEVGKREYVRLGE